MTKPNQKPVQKPVQPPAQAQAPKPAVDPASGDSDVAGDGEGDEEDTTDHVKARVLVTGHYGEAGSVYRGPLAKVESGVQAGELDANPEAVNYAEAEALDKAK